jgi:hypothetical protein
VAEPSLLSGSGFTIPTSRRHHRTSSSASQNLGSQLSTSYEGRPHIGRPPQPVSLSRQDSTTSRRSQADSPAPQSSIDPSNYFQQQRMPPPSSMPMSSSSTLPSQGQSQHEQLSPGLIPTTSRYEETQFYRHELESVKSENDNLKRRIRELERQLQERRASISSRPRSESVSTTASVPIAPAVGASIAGPRDGAPPRLDRGRSMTAQSGTSVGVGVPEDEVRVGESAASLRSTADSTEKAID